jgi:hypothetical protein
MTCKLVVLQIEFMWCNPHTQRVPLSLFSFLPYNIYLNLFGLILMGSYQKPSNYRPPYSSIISIYAIINHPSPSIQDLMSFPQYRIWYLSWFCANWKSLIARCCSTICKIKLIIFIHNKQLYNSYTDQSMNMVIWITCRSTVLSKICFIVCFIPTRMTKHVENLNESKGLYILNK